MLRSLAPTLAALAALALTPPAPAQVPPGFVDELVLGGWNTPVGLTFDTNDRMYVWERAGKVFIVENGVRLAQPLIDLSDEVGGWRDFGLLGFALDPDFLSNGYIYLYYVVDRHHLRFAGTPQYNPATNEYLAATIGRVTRYTANPATNFTSVLPSSRLVLLGATANTGVPILHESHGTGALVFGEDGTLLLSSGDGASYNGVDQGSRSDTYWQTGLADGIIRPAENVGAFRSQMLDSYSGKILRIDPATGAGVPSNPFYDPADPNRVRSKVYALGLRNPFRFTLQRGTGDPNPAAGRPGTLFVGDVQWYTWEELSVVSEPGMNLGWPLFEGLTEHPSYISTIVANLDAPNPLFGSGGCSVQYLRFQDLLKQEQLDHSPAFPNPCNAAVTIAPSTPTFMHRRPVLDYLHGSTGSTRVPTFTGNTATTAALGSAGSPVLGSPFAGNCSVGGVYHSGVGLGPVYNGSYFHVDYSSQWIRAMRFHDHGQGEAELEEVLSFAGVPNPAFLAEDPTNGSLLYLTLSGNSLRRIRFTGSSNVVPVAKVLADRVYGPSPLTVQFDGTGSLDPEGGALSFLWDYGNGATSTRPSPSRTFSTSSTAPQTRVVTMTVTDPQGGSSQTTFPVHLNNTPPVVSITSFVNGSRYSTTGTTSLPLQASASDAEHGAATLSYRWQLYLHHDNHEHPEEPITTSTANVLLTPTPCTGEFFAYRVVLTVTDPMGLGTTVESWLFPDCNSAGVGATINAPAVGAAVLPNDVVTIDATPSGPVQRVDFFVDDVRVGTRFAAPWQATFRPEKPGRYMVSALVLGTNGASNSSVGRAVDVRVPQRSLVLLASGAEDVEERSTGQVSVASSDLDLGQDGANAQRVGLRFAVPVPRSVTITNAWIQFVADEVGTGVAQFTCRAQLADNAAPFGTSSFNLGNRPTTAASVTWVPAPWLYERSIGAAQRTPNLASLVQELVNRPGWNPGQAMAFFFDGFGARAAESFEGTAGLQARLVVEWGTNSVNQAPGVSAGPDGATFVGTPFTLAGSATDDGLPSGTLSVTWSRVSGPSTVTFANVSAAATTATFGSAGTYVLRLTATDGVLTSFDDVTVIATAGQTYETRIVAANDDAEERVGSTTVYLDSVDLELIQDGTRPQVVGLRFPVNVPRNATILEATLLFTVDEVTTGACSLTIAAVAADDAAPITSAANDVSARPRTTQTVNWSPAPWSVVGQAGSAQRSPNLAPVVQAVVNRAGWQSGNDLMFVITGTGVRTAETFEGAPAAAPQLRVVYQ